MHQSAVILMYAVMVFTAWQLKESALQDPNSPLSFLALFFLVLSCVVINGTIRIHLLFTARFNRSAIEAGLRLLNPWKRRVDGLFVLFLLFGGSLVMTKEHLLAGSLVAVAVSYTVVFLVVEPATERAVFNSGKTPGLGSSGGSSGQLSNLD